jgi:hypothetical protein
MPGPWFKTPWWHPARWFGFDLMREDGSGYDPGYEYGRSKKVAREMLRSAYDKTPRRGDMDPRTGLYWNGRDWVKGWELKQEY